MPSCVNNNVNFFGSGLSGLGVYDTDPRYEEYSNMDNIRKHKLKEIIHFFESYKQLQGKKVTIIGVKDRQMAFDAIIKAKELYQRI